ncbi:hypothetical protein SAMN05877809_1019 [Rhodobacter sp. JA431]|nr:hypothetical protein SAMN05877809_1019 [Rhodobacter sp. JA431]
MGWHAPSPRRARTAVLNKAASRRDRRQRAEHVDVAKTNVRGGFPTLTLRHCSRSKSAIAAIIAPLRKLRNPGITILASGPMKEPQNTPDT